MTTLTEFLLARIAEDETAGVHETGCGYDRAEYGNPCRCGWDVRMLAECVAKRRIVLAFEKADGLLGANAPGYAHYAVAYNWAMKVHAAVYADHPDYRDEWR